MLKRKKYYYVFGALFALIIAAQYMLPKPTDWSRNYQSGSKSPFGCYAIHSLAAGVFCEELSRNDRTLFIVQDEIKNNSSLLIINDNVEFNKKDMQSLNNLLEKGHTVMIAANRFGRMFGDSLKIDTEYDYASYVTQTDSSWSKDGKQFTFTAGNLAARKFKYPQLLYSTYFTSFDTTLFKVRAYFDKNRACLLSARIKKGHLYLLSVPDVFGNCFVANHDNREMAYILLSLIRNKYLVWDEHYKTFNIQHYSIIKFILDSDPLYTAYLLLIFSLVLYMIFEGRRRQRPIPILQPNQNSSLDFVNVISHVYYNSDNHHHIAAEKIRYFYESVRRKFNVSTDAINDSFMEEVTVLSGLEKKQVQQLFRYCEQLRNASGLTEYDLVELNRQIHNFNKNSLR